jgi:hypothetical protein
MVFPFGLDIWELVSIVLLQAILLFIGAGIAHIENRTIGKAIWTALGAGVLWLILAVLALKIGLGNIVSVIVVAILTVVIIEKFFVTTLTKALKTLLFVLIVDALTIPVILGILRKFFAV